MFLITLYLCIYIYNEFGIYVQSLFCFSYFNKFGHIKSIKLTCQYFKIVFSSSTAFIMSVIMNWIFKTPEVTKNTLIRKE